MSTPETITYLEQQLALAHAKIEQLQGEQSELLQESNKCKQELKRAERHHVEQQQEIQTVTEISNQLIRVLLKAVPGSEDPTSETEARTTLVALHRALIIEGDTIAAASQVKELGKVVQPFSHYEPTRSPSSPARTPAMISSADNNQQLTARIELLSKQMLQRMASIEDSQRATLQDQSKLAHLVLACTTEVSGLSQSMDSVSDRQDQHGDPQLAEAVQTISEDLAGLAKNVRRVIKTEKTEQADTLTTDLRDMSSMTIDHLGSFAQRIERMESSIDGMQVYMFGHQEQAMQQTTRLEQLVCSQSELLLGQAQRIIPDAIEYMNAVVERVISAPKVRATYAVTS